MRITIIGTWTGILMKKFVLTMLFMLLATAQVFAQEASVIILGTNHVPPFKIVEGEKLSGINADVLQEILRGMNLRLQIKKCPWKRCLTELANGNIDIFLGLFKSPDREKLYYFCKPAYKNRSDKAIYLRSGDGHRVKRYEDLYALDIIGVTRGYKNFDRFDNDQGLHKSYVAKHHQNLLKLISGRIDAFIQTEEAADYLIKTKGYTDKIDKASYKHAKINPSYFVISRKSTFMARKTEFEQNLSRFVESGMYKKISEKWTK